MDTVAHAVGADRVRRPTAKELFACLTRNLLAKAAPPMLHGVSLSRTAVQRGQDVEVEWVATGGNDVRILGADGLEVSLPDTGATPLRQVVTPRASGEIVVEVINAHGSVKAVAGSLTLHGPARPADDETEPIAFLSYAREDRKRVRELADEIEREA